MSDIMDRLDKAYRDCWSEWGRDPISIELPIADYVDLVGVADTKRCPHEPGIVTVTHWRGIRIYASTREDIGLTVAVDVEFMSSPRPAPDE